MTFTTERLALRELRASDSRFVCALMTDPSFVAHIGDRGVHTVEDAQRYIESGPWTRYAALGFGLWLVQLRDTDEPIGVCGLLKRDTLPSPDIGFAFRPQFWSNGYAFESAAAVMRFAANVLHLSQVMAIVSPSNTASIRLLEKLGFERERDTEPSKNPGGVALYVATLASNSG
jgi:RimJ/RimL family protein N-acetyltransferase